MKKINVRVCQGTTCFVMGASNLQELMEIVPAQYGDKVMVEGVPCLGECSTDSGYSGAPYVKIDDDIINKANIEKVLKTIERKLENEQYRKSDNTSKKRNIS